MRSHSARNPKWQRRRGSGAFLRFHAVVSKARRSVVCVGELAELARLQADQLGDVLVSNSCKFSNNRTNEGGPSRAHGDDRQTQRCAKTVENGSAMIAASHVVEPAGRKSRTNPGAGIR